jgi:hypothetical protein
MTAYVKASAGLVAVNGENPVARGEDFADHAVDLRDRAASVGASLEISANLVSAEGDIVREK